MDSPIWRLMKDAIPTICDKLTWIPGNDKEKII
jgi:hypothetical protein